MAIELTCPVCASKLRVDDSAAGKQVRCGRCMTVVQVPGLFTEPPPADLPPPPPPPAPDEPPLFERGDPYPEDEPRPSRAEPRRPPRDRDEDDDLDRRSRDDSDELPRRRPRDSY